MTEAVIRVRISDALTPNLYAKLDACSNKFDRSRLLAHYLMLAENVIANGGARLAEPAVPTNTGDKAGDGDNRASPAANKARTPKKPQPATTPEQAATREVDEAAPAVQEMANSFKQQFTGLIEDD